MPKISKETQELLRQRRKERGWSQSEAAEELGVSLEAVQSWEGGRRFPQPKQRVSICKVYHLSPEQLRPVLEPSRKDDLAPPEDTHAAELTEQHEDTLSEKRQSLEERVLPEPFAAQIEPFFPGQSLDAYRQRMLRRVRSVWIDGVLQHFLSQAVFIPLRLREEPDALANPWQFAVQETRGMSLELPPGTSPLQMYDISGGELLILGEPGAGKTTLLLALARELLSRAEQNENYPIPVVFHLSSWAVKQTALADWLIEELQSKYDVPAPVARTWVETDQLAVLLDGLDEVSADARAACIQAIGGYHQAQKLVPIAVCCRSHNYFEQAPRLAFQKAVQILPLTQEQIAFYLSSASEHPETIQQALQEDPELDSLIQTPLLLRIVTQTYRGTNKIILAGPREDRRRHLFTQYIQQMLERRGVAQYPRQQMIRWLSWLASQMDRHRQNVFYLERMQPDWLADPQALQRYRLLVTRIVLVITVLLFSGLLACFRGDFGPGRGIFFWIGGGPGDSALGWMAPGIGGGMSGSISLALLFALIVILVNLLGDRRRVPTFTPKTLRRALLAGLRWGLLSGGVIGLVAGMVFHWEPDFTCLGGSVSGLACGGSLGLFGGTIVGFQIALIMLLRPDTLLFSRKDKRSPKGFSRKDRLLNALLFGLCGYLGFALIYGWQAGAITRLDLGYSLISGAYFGFMYHQGFETGLGPELGVTIQLAETAVWSWREVRSHFLDNLKKGAMLAMILLGCVTVIITCASSLFYGLSYGIRYGLVYGSVIAVISGVTGLLMGILTSGWSHEMLDEQQFARPNEGVRRATRNALFAACLFGSIGGLTSGLVSALAFALGGVPGWLVLGIGLAIIVTIGGSYEIFMLYGGTALIEHYTLRWCLWRQGVLPWNCLDFCNAAVERVFLSKIGGGYMFLHTLLKEHFAEEESE